MVMGRPTKYNDEIADEICDRLSCGESLSSILRDDHMPHALSVRRWREAKPDFRTKYETARECQEEYYCDEILKVSKDKSKVYLDRKLEMDALKWVSSRMRGGANGVPNKDANQIVTQGDMEEALTELADRFTELSGGK